MFDENCENEEKENSSSSKNEILKPKILNISDENCENEGKESSSLSKHKLREKNISGKLSFPQLLINIFLYNIFSRFSKSRKVTNRTNRFWNIVE